ncbi:hypothetical protein GUITHDRAFT_118396, partial [Guillardia theta CCMP2712]
MRQSGLLEQSSMRSADPPGEQEALDFLFVLSACNHTRERRLSSSPLLCEAEELGVTREGREQEVVHGICELGILFREENQVNTEWPAKKVRDEFIQFFQDKKQ